MSEKVFDKRNHIRNILASNDSPFFLYRKLTFGSGNLIRFMFYELITSCLGPLPGAIGIYLRRKIYPLLLGECGTGLIVGRDTVMRHAGKIRIGNNVTIDDNCLLDARGATGEGMIIGNNVIINRGCCIQSKAGDIRIGNDVSIGANSCLVSWDGIDIGDDCGIAGGCYISAGNYKMNDLEKPVLAQEAYVTSPIVIERGAWIATRATILDGVSIGHDAVVSAGSVVAQNIPPQTVAQGNPARVIFKRR